MRPLAFRPAERAIVQNLQGLAYATQSQLSYWSGYSQTAMSLALSALREMRFVECEKGVTPNICYLSRKASRVSGITLPSGFRKSSWSVMAHTVHRNQCEILLRKKYSDFRFLDKLHLYRLGLNPSHGEHAGLQDGKIIFVLLDDYSMAPLRISQAILRRHSIKDKYCDLKASINWRMISHRFFVASTSKDQLTKHTRWITKKGIKAELLYLPPLWAF